jgi:hypothetical protein
VFGEYCNLIGATIEFVVAAGGCQLKIKLHATIDKILCANELERFTVLTEKNN